MKHAACFLFASIIAAGLTVENWAQAEEICSERGINTAADSPFSPVSVVPVIFGRITVKQPKGGGAIASIVVLLRDGRTSQRFSFDGSGSYCFEKTSMGGDLTVEINGQQADRRSIITNLPEQREDFEFTLSSSATAAPPGVVSAKYNYRRTGKNAKLYEKALSSMAEQKPEKAIEYLEATVKADAGDYIAAATLGSVYYRQKKHSEAERWFQRSVEINPEFVPAWVSLSQSQYAQGKFDAAIESCKRLTRIEPQSAVGFYILGEAYLSTQKGNLAAQALNEAIKLDPIGMAQCHLLLAELYDLNGLKKLATKEYKAFLAKVPNHPERKRLEKYISDNPE